MDKRIISRLPYGSELLCLPFHCHHRYFSFFFCFLFCFECALIFYPFHLAGSNSLLDLEISLIPAENLANLFKDMPRSGVGNILDPSPMTMVDPNPILETVTLEDNESEEDENQTEKREDHLAQSPDNSVEFDVATDWQRET